MEEDYTVLDILHEMLQTDRSFHSVIRFLDGNTRNHIVAAHERNSSQMLAIVRAFMSSQQQVARSESVVMNIPLNSIFDPSGNFLRNFLDPVPVVPTREQIQRATDNHIQVTDVTCAICQEPVTCATRIRRCGHSFHSQCIHEWFTMNTRCPICRHDIRDLHHGNATTNNDNRMHSDEE
jgi:hypothetical protein